MTYIAAALQMKATSDKKRNLATASRLIARAAARKARLVALPEVFLWRGPSENQFQESEPIPGPATQLLGAMARTHRIYLLAGSFLERATRTHSYNTSVLFGPSGDILATYRKIHLFDVELPGQVSVKESASKKSGSTIAAVATPLGLMGLSICYDLRFPELYRALAAKGADIIFVPCAFTRPTGKAHWKTLLQARAIENQCYVIAPNQTGKNSYGYYDYGHSLIIDPWGKIIAQAGTSQEIITAQIDLNYIQKVRRILPALTHRVLEFDNIHSFVE